MTEFDRDTAAYQFYITDLENRHGAYAPGLSEQLLGLGSVYQEQGLHKEAIKIFKRAVHLSRINNGLHNAEQLLRQATARNANTAGMTNFGIPIAGTDAVDTDAVDTATVETGATDSVTTVPTEEPLINPADAMNGGNLIFQQQDEPVQFPHGQLGAASLLSLGR